jgi:hypothetical protein
MQKNSSSAPSLHANLSRARRHVDVVQERGQRQGKSCKSPRPIASKAKRE